MHRKKIFYQIFFVFILILFSKTNVDANDLRPVVLVSIKGDIDSGQEMLLKRALVLAKENKAKALLVELDTFGGAVDAATKMRDALLETDLETVCFVKDRAWSAGALIALSCKNIVMTKSASIGAAEPIPTTEKTVAALRAEFMATAEKRQREPLIAAAMVDKTLGYEGIVEKGQILSLSAENAKKVGFADFLADDRNEVLKHYNWQDAKLIEVFPDWRVKLQSILANQLVQSLLVAVLFTAVLAEIKTGGIGIPAIFAVVAAVLLFAGKWLIGSTGILESILFFGGLICFAIELYMPGVNVFGALGVILVALSLYLILGAGMQAIYTLIIGLVMGILIFALLLKFLPKNRLISKLVLSDQETKEAGFVSSNDYSNLLGKEGTAFTVLRPSGIMDADGLKINVVTEGEYIEKGSLVKINNVEGNRIVVVLVKK